MQCKCECGEETTLGREYVWGHKTKHVRPKEKLNLCECNCGTLVPGRFVKGHVHRLNTKPRADQTLCLCGCGELCAPGKRFLSGHNSRTLEELAKKSERMQRLWDESPEKFDGRDTWNKGLTKETDERLNWNANRQAVSFTDDKREHYRELGKTAAQYLPHPSGSDHPSWKGGVSTVYQMLYGNTRLYREWKFPVLAAASFTCVACGSKGKLNVHHNPIKMSQVVNDVCGSRDVSIMSFEAKKELAERVVDRHLEPNSGIKGVCLCVECHRLAHQIDPDVD